MKAKKSKFSEIKASKAAQLVDKNARTMVKIMQLYEVLNKAKEGEREKYAHLIANIDKFKHRMQRRLVKLSLWADTPVEDRRPESRSAVSKAAVGFGSMQNVSLTKLQMLANSRGGIGTSSTMPLNQFTQPRPILPISNAALMSVPRPVSVPPLAPLNQAPALVPPPAGGLSLRNMQKSLLERAALQLNQQL